ncbi:MAG TPA: hypothetical protein VJT08_01445, partial [Terriglobales bacterium]|nr:hypothetical protein [Terriglobales bacterium]
ASVLAPLSDPLLQETALRTGVVATGLSCSVKVELLSKVCTVTVTLCATETSATLAVKVALLVPCGKCTDEGTCTAELLLETSTSRPFAGLTTSLRVIVQASVPAPVKEELSQEKLLTVIPASYDWSSA